MLLNRSKFTKKLILRLFSSPLTLVPVLAGFTDLLVLWTFNLNSGMGIFAGLAGILGGLGIFLSRLFLDDRVRKETLEAFENDAERGREQRLDALDQRLCADDDPRTEACLRDLRELAKAFQQGFSWRDTLNSRATLDILAGVEQIFTQCVHSLEKTLDLWYSARKMHTSEARRAILDQRERILEDVTESIRELGKILVGIQGIGTEGKTGFSELARIRAELDRSLEVAKRVNRRMLALDKEIGLSGTDGENIK